jgi:hypothetical protein
MRACADTPARLTRSVDTASIHWRYLAVFNATRPPVLLVASCLAVALAGCSPPPPPSSDDAGSDVVGDLAADVSRPDVAADVAADGGPPHDADADGSDGASDTAVPDAGAPDAGPVRPSECEEITLTAALRSSQMINSETYDTQPDLQATASLGGSTGDAMRPNQFFFYLDSADAVGTYAVVPFPNYFYARPHGGGLSVDFATPDGGTGAFTRRYLAVSGTIEVASVLTPHQTQGRLSGVRFNEVTRGSDGSATLVPGGRCYWLASAAWDTRRAGGCVPFATPSTCPAGRQCMPTNAIGDDGVCAAVGTRTEGEECTAPPTGTWDSDCAPGLRCARFGVDLGETTFTCHRICDVRSASPSCPAGTHCGGGYNACLPISYLQHDARGMNSIDTVATVGAACAENPAALYCGASARPGVCFADTGAAGATCRRVVHAGSECPGETAGYVAYKGGIDRSTLFCFH